ncbi:MAG: transposase [Verrucomicrobia bacterium]|nr:transposase [Verrucomicrobiota bacterium]
MALFTPFRGRCGNGSTNCNGKTSRATSAWRNSAPPAAGLIQTTVDSQGQLTYTLDRAKLRTVRSREGRYLLRTNLSADNPEWVWRCYMQLVFVEEAIRTLKGDLGLRPIYHHKAERIEAHLFVAFLAYCLSITLRQWLKALARSLMPRVVLEKLAGLQLLDVRVPTTDGRELLLVRRTEAERDVALLLARLKLTLSPQPPPPTHQPLQSKLSAPM